MKLQFSIYYFIWWLQLSIERRSFFRNHRVMNALQSRCLLKQHGMQQLKSQWVVPSMCAILLILVETVNTSTGLILYNGCKKTSNDCGLFNYKLSDFCISTYATLSKMYIFVASVTSQKIKSNKQKVFTFFGPELITIVFHLFNLAPSMATMK